MLSSTEQGWKWKLSGDRSFKKFRLVVSFPFSSFQLPYPLKMKPIQKVNYFQKREEWKISDVLMNPMIMMMVLPLLLMTVLPKMLNDPETQKEMQEMQKNMASSRNQVNTKK